MVSQRKTKGWTNGLQDDWINQDDQDDWDKVDRCENYHYDDQWLA